MPAAGFTSGTALNVSLVLSCGVRFRDLFLSWGPRRRTFLLAVRVRRHRGALHSCNSHQITRVTAALVGTLQAFSVPTRAAVGRLLKALSSFRRTYQHGQRDSPD